MLVTIEAVGDSWVNAHSAQLQIRQAMINKQDIVLDFCNEGPSFALLGLHKILDNYNPAYVVLHRYPNTAENLPYVRTFNGLSHFWQMSNQYAQTVASWQGEKRFGLFLGRRTRARCCIMYQVAQAYPQQVLLSSMSQPNGLPFDIDDYEKDQGWDTTPAKAWWDNNTIVSIDNHAKNDQWDPQQNTNSDLLKHYPRFGIEIVPETYTLGDTFFVTEKTVRPLRSGKPFFSYGPKHFLTRLKALGFKTWDLIWDEDYDNYSSVQRWNKIKQQLDYLYQLDNAKFAQIVAHAEEIAVYNQSVLLDMLGQNIDSKRI